MPVNLLTHKSYRAKITAEALRGLKKPSGRAYNKDHAEAIYRLTQRPEWQVFQEMLEELANPFRAYNAQKNRFDPFELHVCAAFLNFLGHIRAMCREVEEQNNG